MTPPTTRELVEMLDAVKDWVIAPFDTEAAVNKQISALLERARARESR